MPKSKDNLPNEEYLSDYGFYIRINTLDEFLDETFPLPQQVAIWRSNFFHHFIFLDRVNVDKKTIKLTLIHKINKKPLKLAANVLSILQADCITRVTKKDVHITHKHGKFKLKNGFSLLDFDAGVYFIGCYDEATRLTAKIRAFEAIGLQEIYSGESFNCEHFSNWCFTQNPVSYQSKKLSMLSQIADAGLSTCKGLTGLTAANLIRQTALTSATNATSNSSGFLLRLAGIGIKPVKAGALGVLIQLPIETMVLTYSSLKMKREVKAGMMRQSDMNREITKNVFGSVGSLSVGFGASVAGAAIGTAILPGPGTIVGGTIGGITGGLTGKFGGTLVGSGAYKIGHKAKKEVKKLKHEPHDETKKD